MDCFLFILSQIKSVNYIPTLTNTKKYCILFPICLVSSPEALSNNCNKDRRTVKLTFESIERPILTLVGITAGKVTDKTGQRWLLRSLQDTEDLITELKRQTGYTDDELAGLRLTIGESSLVPSFGQVIERIAAFEVEGPDDGHEFILCDYEDCATIPHGRITLDGRVKTAELYTIDTVLQAVDQAIWLEKMTAPTGAWLIKQVVKAQMLLDQNALNQSIEDAPPEEQAKWSDEDESGGFTLALSVFGGGTLALSVFGGNCSGCPLSGNCSIQHQEKADEQSGEDHADGAHSMPNAGEEDDGSDA